MAALEDDISVNQDPMNVCCAIVRGERAETDLLETMWRRGWMHYRGGLLGEIAMLMREGRW